MDPAMSDDRSEYCFFDLETTVPGQHGQGIRAILEFGAILVCPKRLVELKSYCSLVRPDDLSSISPALDRSNGINQDAVDEAPSFSDIADIVHDFLHGRVWVGHNIEKFDSVIIREAFKKIGRTSPEPKAIVDSLTLLTQRFGQRAGNMKMATLADYFEIGKQTHRSLDDVRMNLEVIKYCAAVLLLESSLSDKLSADRFLKPDEISLTSISASPIPYYRGTHRITLLHKDVALQVFCPCLRVQLGIREKYLDQAGRQKLSFVVDASPRLCEVLDACDTAAKKTSEDCGSNSEWRPVVDRDHTCPQVRLRIPPVANRDIAQYATEIHQKDSSGTVQELVFSNYDAADQICNLFRKGMSVDAFFSLDTYDYQRGAGILLVAEKLVILSD